MERPIKRRVLLLLNDGALTFDEVVKLSGVSRFTLYRWCAEAGVDPRVARLERAMKMWERSAHDRRKKPTKKRLRQIADEAKVEWDQRRDDDHLRATDLEAR